MKEELKAREKEKIELESMRKDYKQMKEYVAEWSSEVKEIKFYHSQIEQLQKTN